MDQLLDIQLLEFLKKNGFTDFSLLEKLCIPKIKSGLDLMCIAPSGCGKTVTIVSIVLHRLKKSMGDNPRALIVVPDTARAIAMKSEFIRFGGYTDLRVNLACENEKISDQKDRIYMGSDVVIGTPKRLNQIYSLYALNISGVKIFAIDDAEEVIRSENYSQTIRLSQGPTKTQFLVFAGRMTELVGRYCDKTLVNQEVIEMEEKKDDVE